MRVTGGSSRQALAIAAMLGGALYLLDRTWRRTGPLVPNEQAAV